jgi:hypothetical protein
VLHCLIIRRIGVRHHKLFFPIIVLEMHATISSELWTQ